MYNVIRTFGVDYIFFDVVFVAIFLILLIRSRKIIPLIAFFVGGFLINFIVDYGIWFHTGIRELILPVNFTLGVVIFFLWFSLSYGIEYAYVFLMFEEKKIKSKLIWTLLIFFGWIAVAILSQNISLNDAQITVIRHMQDFRLLRIIIVFIGYFTLILLKYDWKKIVSLFIIGFAIHFMMEFALLVSGIRPGDLKILFENSLIEFNMGVPFFFLIYDKILENKFPENHNLTH